MISPKKLIKMGRKWRKLAAIKRNKTTWLRMSDQDVDANDSNTTSSIAEKGHFVVYTADHNRFVLPLKYLKKEIMMELFKLAKEEFGTPSSEPLPLPCDAAFLQYVISLIKKNLTEDVENALITSIACRHCSSSTYMLLESRNQPSMICSF